MGQTHRKLWRSVALLLVTLGVPFGVHASRAQTQSGTASTPESRAEAAETAWLALVDSGRYGESWKTASPFLQEHVPQTKFEDSLRAARKPLGKLVARKVTSAQHTTTLPGAPAGDYVVVSFSADFEGRSSAVETVTATHESDGSWRVSGYYIR